MEEEEEQEQAFNSLASLYLDLHEEDFFGLWRRRSTFPETNAALALEQNGMWERAQEMYEHAQVKARSGLLPFSEAEYCLWEERWIGCAKRLQQWDILQEIAKVEGNRNLLLECSWRNSEWSNSAEQSNFSAIINSFRNVPNEDRKIFQCFLLLNQTNDSYDKVNEFAEAYEEGVQLSLQKWVSLPKVVSNAHRPLIYKFHQFVELSEAQQIYIGISPANAANRNESIVGIKSILSSWRDRLPNLWDEVLHMFEFE